MQVDGARIVRRTVPKQAQLNEPSLKAHQHARAMLKQWLEYELEHRAVVNIDEAAVTQAIRKFYTLLQSKYLLQFATGKAANINEAAIQFQNELEKAVNAPLAPKKDARGARLAAPYGNDAQADADD